MKKTFKEATYGLLLIATVFAAFLAASAASEKFFEPTQDQYDSSYKEIGAQQAAYKKAKDNGNYALAHELALFNFQLAWLELNKADRLVDAGKYEEALPLLKACLEHCNAESVCDPKGTHAAQQKKCLNGGAQWDYNLCMQMLESPSKK